ncbi:hypothetical protein PMIN04_003044 [Paraphaeosphaeria minitans]
MLAAETFSNPLRGTLLLNLEYENQVTPLETMPSLTLILITLAIPTLILGTGLPNPSGNISTGLGGDAAIVNNNPAGAKYTATFPGAGANISGTVTAASNANGTGVLFSKAFLYLQDHRSVCLIPRLRHHFCSFYPFDTLTVARSRVAH